MASRSGALRDALVLIGVFGVLLGGLWLYTGTWPPAVIVESGSMMHADSEVTYGRFGTIDPGDLVLVKRVKTADDVQTFVEGGDGTYGKSGDVIVYFSANDRDRVPIIHRAMAYIERVTIDQETHYRVRWNPDAACPADARKDGAWCVWGPDGINIDMGADLRLDNYVPTKGGFVTKGDNPATNREPDQMTGLSRDANGSPIPVQVEWLEGKARGELPWLGLIKLSLASRYNQDDCGTYPIEFHFFEESPYAKCRGWFAFGHAYAPKDLWVMLAISLFLLIGVPLLYDVVRNQMAKRKPADAVAATDAPAMPPASDDAPPPPQPGEPPREL